MIPRLRLGLGLEGASRATLSRRAWSRPMPRAACTSPACAHALSPRVYPVFKFYSKVLRKKYSHCYAPCTSPACSAPIQPCLSACAYVRRALKCVAWQHVEDRGAFVESTAISDHSVSVLWNDSFRVCTLHSLGRTPKRIEPGRLARECATTGAKPRATGSKSL